VTQTESGLKRQSAASTGQSGGQPSATVSYQPAIPASTSDRTIPVPPNQGSLFPRRIAQSLMIAAITATSAVIGLAVAMVLPLPTRSALNPTDTAPNWQTGLQYRVGRPVNILVMGIDKVPEDPSNPDAIFRGRSDTMLLLRVDPTDDSVSLLSIPRDTQVQLPAVGMEKINGANVNGGAPLAAQTVSGVLNGVPIDRYVRISTGAFRELVDLLGGVEVYVPKPMSYQDQTQKLKINLAAGLQTLNGDQAEQFARFRYDAYGDIGRVQRQQVLLKALLKQATNPAVIPRLPSLVTAMRKYVDTNLSPEEMLSLVGAARQLSQGKVKMVMLPGRFSSPEEFVASYWILDPVGRDRVMQQYFKIDPPTPPAETAQSATTLRIAIQNASRHPDAAQQIRRYLSQLGFYNVFLTEDWADQQTETQIIAQQGDLNSAKALQQVLNFGSVAANSTGDLESDLTIRVGDDWIRHIK